MNSELVIYQDKISSVWVDERAFSVIAKFATAQKEANRTVSRQIEQYNPDVIFSVACRVK